MLNIVRKIGGTLLTATWVSSGVIPGSISSALIDGNQNIVSSMAAVSSGNGFYYAVHDLPNTRAWYINEWYAHINVNTYRERQLVRATLPEVD